MTTSSIPSRQHAVQLVGAGELRLNTDKDVFDVGPYQVLGKVEAVGLCFSDLKLLKQFSEHARKGAIKSGIDQKVLVEIPSYVPGDKPTVPGHEAVVRIVAVGEKVRQYELGKRYLVQTDYRALPTANSNASFGYNFEGALQEYVLMDERIIIDPANGDKFLIEVDEQLSASAVALVEPWACVEDSYVNPERRTILAGGRLVVVVDAGCSVGNLAAAFADDGGPAEVFACCRDGAGRDQIEQLGITVKPVDDIRQLPDVFADDIVYFGTDAATIELLNDKLAPGGIINIVTAGGKIGQDVQVGVGRVHYGMTRWIGTTSDNAADAYDNIPATGEVRPGDSVAILGAGGPMGQMHVIRLVCSGVADLEVVATDLDDERLESLQSKAEPLAKANNVNLQIVNTNTTPLERTFSYHALMVPVGALVANAIAHSTDRCLINIFAGIPAPTKHAIDLDAYIANRCFMFGTSGSVIRDMKIVLDKVQSNRLDTNCTVDAVSGMAGATDGIAAVENRTLAGKIIVYPMLHDVGLIKLTDLADRYPTVADKLDNGAWCKAAEEELLRVAAPQHS